MSACTVTSSNSSANSGGATGLSGGSANSAGNSTGGAVAGSSGGSRAVGGANSLGGAGNAGMSGSGTGGAATVDPCGGVDPTEPNNSRDNSTAYTLGSTIRGCVSSTTDHDFYELTVPADAAGGYMQIAVTNVGPGNADVHIYSVNDNGEIYRRYAQSEGQNVSAFVAVAKGQKYRVDIGDFAGFQVPYAYTLNMAYTKLDDSFEPNDTRDSPTAITKGTAIDAYVFAGHTLGSPPASAAYDDWYSVPLAMGTTTVKLENVPTDTYGDLKLFDAGGKELGHEYQTTQGASVTLSYLAPVDGTYYVKAGWFSALGDASGPGEMLPDHFTRKYKLTVSQ